MEFEIIKTKQTWAKNVYWLNAHQTTIHRYKTKNFRNSAQFINTFLNPPNCILFIRPIDTFFCCPNELRIRPNINLRLCVVVWKIIFFQSYYLYQKHFFLNPPQGPCAQTWYPRHTENIYIEFLLHHVIIIYIQSNVISAQLEIIRNFISFCHNCHG